MGSLFYIIGKSVKNRLFDLPNQPAKMISYIIAGFFLVFFMLINALMALTSEQLFDIIYLKGIFFFICLIIYAPAMYSSLSRGSALFSMEDVNYVFVSPINASTVLLYGIANTTKTIAMTSMLVLSQAMNLRLFGIGFSGMALMIFGFILTSLVMQLLSLLIYSLTNGRKGRKRLAGLLAVLIYLPMAALAVYHWQYAEGDLLYVLRLVLDSPVFMFTPIVGWAVSGLVALATGDVLPALLFNSLLIVTGATSVAVIFARNADFYEDVLVAAETAYELRRNQVENTSTPFNTVSLRNVRVRGTGVGGFGASAIFGKQMREVFRENRFGLWGSSSVFTAVGVVAYVLFMNRLGNYALTGSSLLVVVYAISVYIQVFSVLSGRVLTEIYLHYIFLIPESPLKKIVWLNISVLIKSAVDGLLIFCLAGYIGKASLLVILMMIVLYALSCLMVVALDLAAFRITGVIMTIGIFGALFMFVLIILLLPGIIGGVILSSTGLGVIGFIIAQSIWVIIVSIIAFMVAKDVLHNCDLPQKRLPGSE